MAKKKREQIPPDALEKLRRLVAEGNAPRLDRVDVAALRYRLKLEQGIGPTRVDGQVEEQVERFREAAEEAESLLMKVRPVLERFGVMQTQKLAYYNFARHLQRLRKLVSGPALAAEAAMALDRWTAMGCRQEVLEAVRGKTFGVRLDAQP